MLQTTLGAADEWALVESSGRPTSFRHRLKHIRQYGKKELFMPIISGTMEQLLHPSGEWIIVDLGFAAENATCGYLSCDLSDEQNPKEKPELLTFTELNKKLATKISGPGNPLHLVIEAPLSAAFENENPLGREVEVINDKRRYWYVQSGAVVTLAALYLLKNLHALQSRETRLFEGFVSFKEDSTDHKRDVVQLYKALVKRNPKTRIEPRPIKESGQLRPITGLLGHECAPPPILKAA
jgi:hypothetical protein